jgi:predicted RNase H-like HicB family nuclease
MKLADVGPSSVRVRANGAWERAGPEPLGLHSCRHTFASPMTTATATSRRERGTGRCAAGRVTSRERLRPGLTATVWSMSETLRLTITYDEPDEEGWIVARVVEVPGALSQGRTREEAKENVLDALRLMLAPDDDDANVAAGRSEPLELTLTE